MVVGFALLQLHELCATYLDELGVLHPPFCLVTDGVRGDHLQHEVHDDRAGKLPRDAKADAEMTRCGAESWRADAHTHTDIDGAHITDGELLRCCMYGCSFLFFSSQLHTDMLLHACSTEGVVRCKMSLTAITRDDPSLALALSLSRGCRHMLLSA